MNMMRCPQCRTENAVHNELCWSCGADLWPQAHPERLPQGRQIVVARPAPPEAPRGIVRRLLRRLLGRA